MSKKEYKTPSSTVDVIIELDGGIVLIERRNEPRGWAIPGGFVDYGERLEDAAIREAREETRLDVTLTHLLGVYSDPARDPRLHTISAAFVATSTGIPVADDDAKNAGVFPLDALPSPLCFDHAQILADYTHFKATGANPPPRPSES